MQKTETLNLKNRALIINELQNGKHSILKWRQIAVVFSAFFIAFVLFSCSSRQSAEEIAMAEELLWSDPDSCLAYLDELDCSKMTEHDLCVCALEREHAKFKVEYGLADDSTVMALKDYFETQGDHRYAGEACYIIGRNYVLYQNLPMSAFYQKSAEEHLLKAKQTPSQLLGMVYYGLGRSAEYERLFEIANEYYQKSLPYFIASGDSLYICSAYRDIAKSNVWEDEFSIEMLDSAELYIPSKAGDGIRLDMEKTRLHYFLNENPSQYINIYHTLCDSLGYLLYAAELCQYYMDEHKPDSAAYYLALSELDTANSTWSKEHYLFNKARYNYETGRKDSAYFILRDLHLWQTEEIEASAHTRAYMVEQRYDAERERADRIQAEADKRRAHLIIIIGTFMVLLLICILLLLYQRERMKKQQKEETNRIEMVRLKAEHDYKQRQLQYEQEQLKLANDNLRKQLLLRQKHLQEQLRMRLNISSELKKQRNHTEKFSEATYKKIISKAVFLTVDQLEQLKEDFDIAYAGFLSDLSARYRLTGSDKLYVVLITLGCSVGDISELVNVSAHSVGNQKQRLRQHVEATCSIDEWLKNEVAAYLNRVVVN